MKKIFIIFCAIYFISSNIFANTTINNATIEGLVTYVPGLEFDGGVAFAQNFTADAFVSETFSVYFRVEFDSFQVAPENDGRIIQKLATSGSNIIWYAHIESSGLPNQKIGFGIVDVDADFHGVHTDPLTAGVVYDVFLTCVNVDGTRTMTIWYNGIQGESDTFEKALYDQDRSALLFGGSPVSMDGVLYKVKYYNVLLSNEEMNKIRNNIKVSRGLISDWDFNNGTGSKITDIEGGYTMSITGAEWTSRI